MRVLCCGSRDWNDIQTIADRLEQLPKDTVIIHGDARGADRICGLVAEELGMTVESYPAEWNKFGDRAGTLRNQWMLSQARPELVIGFKTHLASVGTNHMLMISGKAGIDVEIIKSY